MQRTDIFFFSTLSTCFRAAQARGLGDCEGGERESRLCTVIFQTQHRTRRANEKKHAKRFRFSHPWLIQYQSQGSSNRPGRAKLHRCRDFELEALLQ